MVKPISYNADAFSGKARVNLATSSKNLATSFQRLSTGLRINRASDDAAGLAVSERLSADARIFARAIRNVNDGISAVGIVGGAVSELSNILLRLKELAAQASNGSYSRVQRLALDSEGSALQAEYNRIVESVDFNNLKLIDASLGQLTVQAGYGANSYLSFQLDAELDRNAGDGTLQARTALTNVPNSQAIGVGDLNGDGNLDMISGGTGSTIINVFLGNGNGTFLAPVSYRATGGSTRGVTIGDFDRDGDMDVGAVGGGTSTYVFLNNGNGTFNLSVSYATSSNSGTTISSGDLNGDGLLDLVTAAQNDGDVRVLLGCGNGTFATAVSYDAGNNGAYAELGDFNSDGILDIIATQQAANEVVVLLGNGDGSFKARITSAVTNAGDGPMVGDFNFDGYDDVAIGVIGVTDTISVMLGNGDGTFRTASSFATGDDPSYGSAYDLNGDGALDLIYGNFGDDKLNIALGNGDGTFKARVSYAAGSDPMGVAFGDFNRDGNTDIANAVLTGGTVDVFLQNVDYVTTLPRVNLTTQADARESMTVISAALERINLQNGHLGAIEKRLSSALTQVTSRQEISTIAADRFRSVDVADEAASMIKNQILQQSSIAIFAQANQVPNLVLELLS